jgi:hypothetical protein
MKTMTIWEVDVHTRTGKWATVHGPANSASQAAERALRSVRKALYRRVAVHVASVRLLAVCDWVGR